MDLVEKEERRTGPISDQVVELWLGLHVTGREDANREA